MILIFYVKQCKSKYTNKRNFAFYTFKNVLAIGKITILDWILHQISGLRGGGGGSL